MARPWALLEVPITLIKFLLFYVVGAILWLRPSWLKLKKSVENEVILVTGAGNGLGRALALRLAARGAKLVLWDLHKEPLDQTQKLIQNGGGKAWSFVCDVSDRKAVRETATKVKNKVGPVTMLINNAGILFGKRFEELSEEGIERIINVNVLAHFWTCKAFLPDMMASNRGHVVCIASIAGLMGSPKLTDYCTSKYAVVGFMESLSQELRYYGHDGVKTTLVCPYFFSSGLYSGLGQGLVGEMTLDEVADAAVQGILTEETLCTVPWWFEVHLRIWSITPSLAKNVVASALDIGGMIKNFVGARDISIRKTD